MNKLNSTIAKARLAQMIYWRTKWLEADGLDAQANYLASKAEAKLREHLKK